MKIRTTTCCSALLVALWSPGQTWRKVFGAYGQDEGKAVTWVAEDRILVAGSTGSGGAGASDIYLMEINGSGERQWSNTLGSEGSEQANDLVALTDGSLLIAGFTNASGNYDGLLIKTDPFGQVIWQHTYGGEDWDFFRELLVLPNGELVLVGQSYGPGTSGDVWFMRLAADGTMLTELFYGGVGEQSGFAICATGDGFALAGSTGVDDEADALLIRIDGDGNEVWSNSFGGDSLEVVYDVIHTADGGFSLVGVTHSWSVYEEGYHLKTDGNGIQQWTRNWGQINDQGSYKHVQLPSGEYMTVGYTKTSGGGEKDMFLLKSTELGDFVFGRTFGGGQNDVAYSLAVNELGFLCAGWSESYGAGGRDVFVVRTDENGTTQSQVVSSSFDPVQLDERISELVGVYPNPSHDGFTVSGLGSGTWRLFDPNGRQVAGNGRFVQGEAVVLDLDPAFYTLLLEDQNGRTYPMQLVIVGE